jgi:hypothetical protein
MARRENRELAVAGTCLLWFLLLSSNVVEHLPDKRFRSGFFE